MAVILAQVTRRSRSQLYAEALREYVGRHAHDEVTEAMNEVCHRLGVPEDRFTAGAARRTLERVEW
jgi:predicted transcriptional regulator